MYHGKPIWFELSAAKGGLSDADDFYSKVFGWSVADAGMQGFTYHLASYGGDMVAGMMEMPDDCAEIPPFWMVYFDVDDADAAASKVKSLGGKIFREPADIPRTGRFAILSDPQGAAFGVLQPLPMDKQNPSSDGGAFDQNKESHGNWIELMSSDPKAGFDFYAELLGWTKSTPVDMGEMGTYQLFSWQGADIGGMMGLGNSPVPNWLPYFGVNGVNDAIERISSGGGELLHGPVEVPGGAFIAFFRDPQGAHFSIVGPKENTP
ncbi:VOC family protein [Paracoccus aestuariivivens]|uniref:VOC family protein n=1 Tax=Paracoccus aestuariivivens TaxID=1820333 RepID=A0A6L6J7F2_9RHOB|nr:VOC family protein [Paracoccus aestuariivivens]MTH76659.1 VOC family protein [Paracoccus aestuariivivens]